MSDARRRGAPDSTRTNLAEQAYARLKAQIHDFELLPGERIAEAELGARLGMSRTPVREALFRLRNEGFLEVESKTGWVVRPLDFERLDQLYDLRIVLELASVARLCARQDPPDLEALKSAWLVGRDERPPELREVGALDEVFHATLVRAAGNGEIARVHWDVTERIRVVRRLDFTREERVEATYAEHARILRAVMRRKADEAQLLLRSHIEQSKAAVRKITIAALHAARAPASGGYREP